MRVNLTIRHFNNNKSIGDFFQTQIDKLSDYLSGFSDDLISVRCILDKNQHKEEYYASLNLSVPHTVLHSRGVSKDLFIAISSAFDLIIRQLDKVKEKSRIKRKSIVKDENLEDVYY